MKFLTEWIGDIGERINEDFDYFVYNLVKVAIYHPVDLDLRIGH